MRRGLLSLAAIALAIPVLYGTITGRQSLEASAVRLVVLAVAVSILDRYAAPMVLAAFRTLGAGTDPRSR